MIVTEQMSAETYERIALSDPDRQWELHEGRLREKPAMSIEHNGVVSKLGYVLQQQLGWNGYRVRANLGRVRRSAEHYYIPDVMVIPTAVERRLRERSGSLEVYDVPLPLVVEIWSPSTGDYDTDEKLGEYQRRGDLEIWRIHPYERTLIAWQRQANGSYDEMTYHEGIVRLASLPTVAIDLDTLFDA